MYRLSPTLLDSYRLYCEQDWMSLPDIEARIRREPMLPTPAMGLGKAFHEIAEGVRTIFGDWYLTDEMRFDRKSADQAIALIPPGVSEVPCARIMDSTIYGPVQLSGRVDRLVGLTPWEIKTKTEILDPERYADSLQWLAYAWMLGVREVQYLLVQLEEKGGIWRVKDADTLTLYAPNDPMRVLRPWIERLMTHAERRGLLEHLNREEV